MKIKWKAGNDRYIKKKTDFLRAGLRLLQLALSRKAIYILLASTFPCESVYHIRFHRKLEIGM